MGDNEKLTATEETRTSRPTLGLIIGDIGDEISQSVWAGINDLAQERDFNLICIIGENLQSEIGFSVQANVLYELVSQHTLDGLVVWGGGIGQYGPPEAVKALCKSFQPMPVVNAALLLEGIPSVLVSNYEGMRQAVNHLVQWHEFRRIAFVRGPEGHPEADDRFRAYQDVLTENDIPFDPDLVAPGNFQPESGSRAIQLFMDKRGLKPGAGFQAIAVVDDLGAVSAIEALQERGIRVPGEVAIVGFDDAKDGWYVTPPLTTVPGMVYQQAQRAAWMVLDMLEGKEAPELVTLPSELVIRQSCGCMDPIIANAAVEPSASQGAADLESPRRALTEQREAMVFALIQTVSHPSEQRQEWVEWATQLVDALIQELAEGQAEAFLICLDTVLRQVADSGGNIAEWHGLLSALRRYTLPHLGTTGMLAQAENLWQQARVLLAGAAERAQAYANLLEQRRSAVLLYINQSLTMTNELDEMRSVLAELLPNLGMPSGFLSLYSDPDVPTGLAQLIIAYRDGQRLDEQTAKTFPAHHLAPDQMFRRKERFSMALQSLFYRSDQIGFILTETGPKDALLLETMRVQLSSVLRQTLLLQQLERRALQLQTAAEISHVATGTLDLDDLVNQTVELARERFDLYYAGLFLVDDTGEWAVLRLGTGEAGRKMMADGHRLEIGGNSMVGACIATHKARIALDVGEEATRFENPHLPDTRSELALPLISRGRTIGALTIQGSQKAAFGQVDIATFRTMADVLANAVENASLFTQSQNAPSEIEAVQRRYLQGAWTDYASSQETVHGYVQSDEIEGPSAKAWLPAMTTAIQQEKTVAESAPDGDEETSLALPIQVYGETIGALGFSRRKDQPWNDQEVALVQSIVKEVAEALERQRLFDETQSALNEARIFRQFAEASGQGISMADLDGQLIYGNPTFCRLMGIDDPANMMGASMLSFYPAETQLFMQEQVIPSALEQATWAGELDVVSPNGKVTPTIQNIFLIRDKEGNPHYLAGVVTDITDRRQAEAEIQNTLYELENLNRAMSRERWQAFSEERPESTLGYLFDQVAVRPASAQDLPDLTAETPSPDDPTVLVPVTVRGEPIGIIGIQDDPDNPLSDEERALLEAISSQVADALESARLFEETRDARADAEVLYQAGADINEAQDYQELLQALRQNTMLGQADRDVSINVFDRPWSGTDKPELVTTLARSKQLPEDLFDTRYPIQPYASIFNRLQADQPTLMADVAQDMRISKDIRDWHTHDLGVHSLLYIPLVIGGQWFGFIQGMFGNPITLTDVDSRRLTTLASQVAIAVQSLRQLDEIQAQAGREQTLRQVAEAIGRSENLVENLPFIAQYLHGLLPINQLTLATLAPGDIEYEIHPVIVEHDTYVNLDSVTLPLRGTSFGWTMKENKSLLQTDIRSNPRFEEDAQLITDGLISRLVAPLQVGGRVIGALGLHSQHPGSYTKDHLPVLKQIAGQMALALERSRLLDETQAALERVEETYRRYLEREWGDFLTSTSRTWGYIDGINGLENTEDIWSTEIEEAIQQGAIVAKTKDESANGRGSAALALPIKLRGQTIGVLDFTDENADRVWSEDDKMLVEALANQVALALENARLLEQTERRAHRERLSSELASKIHAAGDTRAILATAADELGRALGVSRSLIRLGGAPANSPSETKAEADDSTNGKQ